MSLVRLPTPLRPFTQGRKELEVQAETVGAALDDLVGQYPGLRPHLFDEQGQLRPYVTVFLNGDDVRGMQGSETTIADDDRLTIVPSIAGGKR